jgi:hypothetical protein
MEIGSAAVDLQLKIALSAARSIDAACLDEHDTVTAITNGGGWLTAEAQGVAIGLQAKIGRLRQRNQKRIKARFGILCAKQTEIHRLITMRHQAALLR